MPCLSWPEIVEPLAGDWTANSGYEIGKNCRETVIYCSLCSKRLIRIIAAFEEVGLSVLEDVSVVGVDDSLEDHLS